MHHSLNGTSSSAAVQYLAQHPPTDRQGRAGNEELEMPDAPVQDGDENSSNAGGKLPKSNDDARLNERRGHSWRFEGLRVRVGELVNMTEE